LYCIYLLINTRSTFVLLFFQTSTSLSDRFAATTPAGATGGGGNNGLGRKVFF